MTAFLGIDPGKRGAFAIVLSADIANVWDTPVDRDGEYDLEAMCELVRRTTEAAARGGDVEVLATMENGRIMPAQIRDRATGRMIDTHQAPSALAEQWRGIGIWQGILAALGIPVMVVPPATWKRAMGVTKDKQTSIDRARALFPGAAHLIYRQKDEGRAEALLICEHGRRQPIAPRMAL